MKNDLNLFLTRTVGCASPKALISNVHRRKRTIPTGRGKIVPEMKTFENMTTPTSVD